MSGDCCHLLGYLNSSNTFVFSSQGLTFTCPGGIHMFTLFNNCAPSWNLIFFALIEVILVAWVYGMDNFLENITEMLGTMNPLSRVNWRETLARNGNEEFFSISVILADLLEIRNTHNPDYFDGLWNSQPRTYPIQGLHLSNTNTITRASHYRHFFNLDTNICILATEQEFPWRWHAGLQNMAA